MRILQIRASFAIKTQKPFHIKDDIIRSVVHQVAEDDGSYTYCMSNFVFVL